MRLEDLFESVLRQDALTIALVHGACVAGGCGLATAHDFVVAADDARFLYSEVRIGFVAALVATYLPLRLRGSDIRELLLNPQFVDAGKALEIGLSTAWCPPRTCAAWARRWRRRSWRPAARSPSPAPSACSSTSSAGRSGEAMTLAAEVNAAARATDDCKRGIATFLETKKPPTWR